MKFSLKTLITTTTIIAISLAIFLRPIRMMLSSIVLEENYISLFGNGFLYTFYWLFWLCYNEDWLMKDPNLFSFNVGIVFGFLTHTLLLFYLLIVLLDKYITGKWRLDPLS